MKTWIKNNNKTSILLLWIAELTDIKNDNGYTGSTIIKGTDQNILVEKYFRHTPFE